MVDVKFFTAAKKPNSTLIPSGGVSAQCLIFEPCSILNPVLKIAGRDMSQFNYCYIPSFGNRYYFINNWEWRDAMWFCNCSCDVLATYRTSIGNSTQYVSRSSAKGNAGILDTAYVPYASPTILSTVSDSIWTGGCYVVGTIGKTGTEYYIIDSVGLTQLVNFAFSDQYANAILEGYEETYPELKAQLNPLQYISSVRWFPINFEGEGGFPISLGWVTTPVSGIKIALDRGYSRGISLSVPKHPQGGVDSYLNLPPYAEYWLRFPPFGIVQLDSTAMAALTSIGCSVLVDARSGDASLRVHDQSDNTISLVHGRLGVDIQLAQITAPGWGTASTVKAVASGVAQVTGVLGQAASQGAAGLVSGISSLVGTAVDTVGSVASSKIPSSITTGGGSGGAASFAGAIQLVGEFLPVVNKDNAGKGFPLCEMATISSIPGYIETYWPRLEIPALAEEIATIYRFMTGGFYFE